MENKPLQHDAEEFLKNYSSATGYHMRAIQFLEENKRSSLVFNVASVAIECYLLAACSYHGEIPFNHNYNSLMNTVERVIEFDPQLSASIRSLDEIFGICSIEEYHHGVPTENDAEKVLKICDDLHQMFDCLGIRSEAKIIT